MYIYIIYIYIYIYIGSITQRVLDLYLTIFLRACLTKFNKI